MKDYSKDYKHMINNFGKALRKNTMLLNQLLVLGEFNP